jgi:chromosome segregation ATPase
MAAAPVAESRPRTRPGWMNIPGGPKEPNFQDFRNKMQTLNTQKTKLFDSLKELQGRAGPRDDAERESVMGERQELRRRMNEIDANRKKERDARSTKNEEISRIRRQRADIEGKLKELGNELGAFRELSDIEMAIDHIMVRMETSGGGLASEKKAIKRLSQLEEAKSLLLQLQPLQEAITDADDREASLQQEYREIHERIGALNKDYDEQYNVKQSKDKEAQKTSVDRTVIIKERDDLRQKITKLNDEMTKLREGFNSEKEAWEVWREEAIKKYGEKMDAERKERDRRRNEYMNAEKIARKQARATKRQNPHENQIGACSTLVRYLRDRIVMSQRDEEERKRRVAMASFDPSASAPSGFALAAPIELPKKKSKAAPPKADEKSERTVSHNEEKKRLFEFVGVAAPASLSEVEKTIDQLKKKQAEFESHIKTGDLVLSSDDEEEEKEDATQTEE